MTMQFQYWEGIQRSLSVKEKIWAVKTISQVIAHVMITVGTTKFCRKEQKL